MIKILSVGAFKVVHEQINGCLRLLRSERAFRTNHGVECVNARDDNLTEARALYRRSAVTVRLRDRVGGTFARMVHLAYL